MTEINLDMVLDATRSGRLKWYRQSGTSQQLFMASIDWIAMQVCLTMKRKWLFWAELGAEIHYSGNDGVTVVASLARGRNTIPLLEAVDEQIRARDQEETEAAMKKAAAFLTNKGTLQDE